MGWEVLMRDRILTVARLFLVKVRRWNRLGRNLLVGGFEDKIDLVQYSVSEIGGQAQICEESRRLGAAD